MNTLFTLEPDDLDVLLRARETSALEIVLFADSQCGAVIKLSARAGLRLLFMLGTALQKALSQCPGLIRRQDLPSVSERSELAAFFEVLAAVNPAVPRTEKLAPGSNPNRATDAALASAHTSVTMAELDQLVNQLDTIRNIPAASQRVATIRKAEFLVTILFNDRDVEPAFFESASLSDLEHAIQDDCIGRCALRSITAVTSDDLENQLLALGNDGHFFDDVLG